MSTEAATTPPSPRLATALRRIVWLVAALEAGLLGFAPILFPQLLTTGTADENVALAAFLATIALVVLVFATAGLLIVSQQRDNAVGWLLLTGGASLGAVFIGYLVGVSLTESDPGTGSWFVLAGAVSFGPAFFLLGPALASVFPNGRPLPGSWSVAFWAGVAGIVVGAVITAFAPGPLEETIAVVNPLGIGVLPAGMRSVGNAVTNLVLAASASIAVASLVVRYRQSSSEAQHQVKWFLFAGAVVAVVLPLALAVGETWTAILALVALGLVPVAVLVAVLRYRLYEIDTLINRTLVYVPLVGIVAGLYAGCVALLQRIFTAATGDTSDAAAVISALALAAVFTPIRNALQAMVDKRFKAAAPEPTSRWDEPEFRAAVEAIVRDVTGQAR